MKRSLLLLSVLLLSLRAGANNDTIDIAHPGEGGEEQGWILTENDFGRYVYIFASGNYVITGAGNDCGIMVDGNIIVTITLQNVRIEKDYPFYIRPESIVTLHLKGINVMKAASRGAGIVVPAKSELIIEGLGGLYALGGNRDGAAPEPGIGGYDADTIDAQTGVSYNDCGSVTIRSGVVCAAAGGNAVNSNESAAIGSCFGGVLRGNITINGGFVYAVAGDHACGLGGGYRGGAVYEIQGAGKISITGGIVIASSIGKSPPWPQPPDYYDAYPVATEISGPALICSRVINATVFNGATRDTTVPADMGLAVGSIYDYGRITLTDDTLTIPQDVKLIVSEDFTLDVNHRVLITNDTIINYGSIINDEYFTGVQLDAVKESWIQIPDQTYTGSPIDIEQIITVTDRNKLLYWGEDYTVALSGDIVNAGTVTAIVTGATENGIYTATASKCFSIIPKQLSGSWIQDIPPQIWTGDSVKPAITAKEGNRTPERDRDYTGEYRNNVKIGTATVTFTGKGNYSGALAMTFTINPKPVVDNWIEIDDITLAVSVKDGDSVLTQGRDYTIVYPAHIDASTDTITIQGLGNYTGTASRSVKSKHISDSWIVDIPPQTWTGDSVKPAVMVKGSNRTLILNTDYIVSYSNNIEVGTAGVSVAGTGDYTGGASKYFMINPKPVDGNWVENIPAATYTDDSIKPAITVKDGNRTLVWDRDYTIAYTDNINAGTASVIITGQGNYTGAASKAFTIAPKRIVWIQDIPEQQSYTGDSIKPFVVVNDGYKTLICDRDYIVRYYNNIDVGIAVVAVTGIGNYAGTESKSFTIINPKTFLGDWIENIPDLTYTGDSIPMPAVIVKDGATVLEHDRDYTIAYSGDTINAGTVTVTVTGKGNYTGKVSKTFTITPRQVSGSWIQNIPAQTGTGDSIEPALTVADGYRTLILNRDYTVAYSNNINQGTAVATITGIGNYTGSASKYFLIVPAQQMLAGDWILDISLRTYTGSAIRPVITVMNGNTLLTLNTDYTVAYDNNVNVGMAIVTVTGIGSYTGSAKKTFIIGPKPVAADCIGNIPAQTYTGDSVKPALSVKDGSRTLTPNTDYSVTYSNNVNAGTATVTIIGTGNYTGTASGTFDIVRRGILIEESWVQLIPDQYYTGYALIPEVVVTGLTLNVDYTVSYYDNIEMGTATVVIAGIGNYTGGLTLWFRIIATGTEEPASAALRIAPAAAGGILVSGLTPGKTLSIYTLQGQLIYQATAASPEEYIHLQEKGVYILYHAGQYSKFSY
ncbi:MAG: Ig-like domain-containing protein [Bacteroidales bacterium]